MGADEARAAFAVMVEDLRGLEGARKRAEAALTAEYHAALVEAATPAKGRAPKDAEAAWKKLPEETRAALRAQWTAQADEVWRSCKDRREALELDLRELAEHVPVRAGAKKLVVESRSSSTNRSTCRGADYARAGARIAADGLKGAGFEVAVEPYWYDEAKRGKEEPDGFHVVASVEDEVDVEVLKRLPGVPLREWVRLCWAYGANPRVFNPYLPHGYEEREGLDFHGRDLRAAGGGK